MTHPHDPFFPPPFSVHASHYWFTTFVFDWIIYLLATIVFFAFCAMFQFKFILQTSPFIYLGLYLAWGSAMIAWAIFISAFVQKGNAATISGYAIVLLSSFIGVILELIIWSNQNGRPFIYMMIPPFAFIHGMVYILGRCIDYKCLKLDDISSDDPWTISMIYLLAMTPVYMDFGLYFDLIIPSEFGIPKHPLFFLKRFSEKKKAKSTAAAEESTLLVANTTSPGWCRSHSTFSTFLSLSSSPNVSYMCVYVHDICMYHSHPL
jgi:hypothetical protein